jgi:hypothetical protein
LNDLTVSAAGELGVRGGVNSTEVLPSLSTGKGKKKMFKNLPKKK